MIHAIWVNVGIRKIAEMRFSIIERGMFALGINILRPGFIYELRCPGYKIAVKGDTGSTKI